MPCIDLPDPNFERYAKAKDLLCALLTRIEAESGPSLRYIDQVIGLRRWWEIHKAEDALERARKL